MKRILIVDDNAQNLYMLDILLKTNGFEVEQASNGSEALEAALRNPPEMIISDILMPVMDGFSLCRAWKTDERLKSIPFIFYTATYTDPKDEEFALHLGADRFLVKPTGPNEFLQMIHDIIKNKDSLMQSSVKGSVHKEEEFYKVYSETLIRKLENKVIQVEQANRRLSVLYQASCDLTTIKPQEDLIRNVLCAVVEMAGYQPACYFRYDESHNELSLFDSAGFSEETIAYINKQPAFKPGEEQGLVGLAAQSRQAIHVADTALEPNWNFYDPSIQSALFVPVFFEKLLLGVIAIFSKEKSAFSENDENNITALANSLAISIKNRQAEEEIRLLNNQLEERVIERTAQLEAANKELEAFSYSVSHDLRAPLRALAGFSEILIDQYGNTLDTDGNNYLMRIHEASEQMKRLIDALMELARVSQKEMIESRVNLSAIARDILSELQQNSPHRKTEIIITEGLVVQGDSHLLRIALQNLLDNAWKYSSKCELSQIEVGVLDQGHHHLKTANNHRMNIYYIRDNGVGFDMAYADKLFSPFQRLHHKDEFPGTGIGLSTVQRIINRHGGKVWAESAVNQGATFYFTLREPQTDIE